MKKLLLVLVVSFSVNLLIAQNSKWSQTEVILQTRLLSKPNDFNTLYDVGIGTRWNYNLNSRLSLNLGGFINYGEYSKNGVLENGTLFIDFFKSTEIHYFIIENIKQLTVETPISFQFHLGTLGNNKVAILGGGSPQLVANNSVSGFRFNTRMRINDNLTDKNFNLLNDVLLNVGFSIVRPINEQRHLLLEFGYEYSTMAPTSGLFLRTGIDF